MPRIKKSYLYTEKNILVLQVSSPLPDTEKQRFFLVIDYSKKPIHLSLTDQNPFASLTGDSHWNSNLKPRFSEKEITTVRKSPKNNDLVLGCSNGMAFYFEEKHPPVIHVVHLQEKADFLRLSSNGTYSKLWKLSDELCREFDSDFSAITVEYWFAELVKFSDSKKRSPIKGESADFRFLEENTPNETSPQHGEYNALLRRMLKTNRKNLQNIEEKLQVIRALLSKESTLTEMVSRSNEVQKSEATYFIDEKDRKLELPLESTLSFSEMSQALYKEIKRAKKSEVQLTQRLAETHTRIDLIEQALETKDYSSQDLLMLIQEGQKRRATADQKSSHSNTPSDPQPKSGYIEFRLSDKVKILVGKNAQGSDQMLKSSPGDALWFHVTSGKGAHVLAMFSKKNISETEASRAKTYGQILAVHHSDWRRTKAGEVYSGRRLQIKKPKGGAAGLWIPQSCEAVQISYSEDQLRDILRLKV